MTDKTIQPTITQDMINAYDEYTHLTLDRRGFMEKLTKLAGSGVAAATIAPLLGASAARAAMVEDTDPRVEGGEVPWPGQGGEMKGYLALPKERNGKLPGVIVIHENRGLNAHIKDVARRMALEGFAALAPDFLSPAGGTPENEDTARDMIGKLDGNQTTANAVASVAFLSGHESVNGKAGAMGFCWGGGLVNSLAVLRSETGGGRCLLWPSGRCGRCAENHRAADAALWRTGRAHQRRHSGVRGGAKGRGQDLRIVCL